MGYWLLLTLSRGENTQQRAGSSGENVRGKEPMSEASGREQMERRLVQRSLEDGAFCLWVVHRPHRTLLSRFRAARHRNLQDGSRLLDDHYTGPDPSAP